MLNFINKKPVAVFVLVFGLVGGSALVAGATLTFNSNSVTGDADVTLTAGSKTIIYGSSTTGYVGIGTTTPPSFFIGAGSVSTLPVLDVGGSVNMATASSGISGTVQAGLYQGGTLLLWGDDTSPLAGGGNIALGTGVMAANTSAYRNVGIGRFALPANTSGYENVSIGTFSMVHNTIGNDNIAIGQNALGNPVAAIYNVAIGYSAMNNATSTAGYNVGIGYQALQSSQGSENVGIGDGAGRAIVTGNNNVMLGAGAGLNATGSSSIMIGFQAGQNETNSNRLYIANSNTTRPLIYGDFASSSLTVFGRFNIGISSPSSTIQISTTTPIIGITDTTSGGRTFYERNGIAALGTYDIFDNTSGTTRFAITAGGKVGIGTATPQDTFQVAGHIIASSTSPTVSSCGGSPAIVGSDGSGQVTIGSAPGTSCTLAFNASFPRAPACVASWNGTVTTTPITATTTASGVTFSVFTSYPASAVLNYICQGF